MQQKQLEKSQVQCLSKRKKNETYYMIASKAHLHHYIAKPSDISHVTTP